LRQQPVAGSEGRKLKSAAGPIRNRGDARERPDAGRAAGGSRSKQQDRTTCVAARGSLAVLAGASIETNKCAEVDGAVELVGGAGQARLAGKAVCDDGVGRAECSLGSLATDNRPMGGFVIVQKRLGWARCVGGA
jgi:hypothetical protein